MPGHVPSFTRWSLKQIPHAFTRIRTSPGPGTGISRLTSSNSPPALETCATRFFAMLGLLAGAYPDGRTSALPDGLRSALPRCARLAITRRNVIGSPPMSLAPRTYTLEYPYTRTVGPVVGKFLTGLRDGRLFGIRCRGRVICPPIEFDPESGETLELDFVEVGPGGVVESFSWIAEPTRKHPFPHPFAFALIRLDGADTAIVHAVDASGPDAMSKGMRVRAQYRKERTSAITDVYFAPEAEAADSFVPATGQGDVAITDHLISLVYEEPLTAARERYATGLLAGRFIGQRSPKSGKVFVPSSGYDPLERVVMTEKDDVELPLTGTVVGFTVIT